MSIEGLVLSLGPEFKAWCPKCKSTNVHLMAVKGAWSGRVDYSFTCYACGLRKYGDDPVHELLTGLSHEWRDKAADREAAKARRAEEAAQKARIRDVVEKNKADQRARDEEARRLAEEEDRRRHREWLEKTKRARKDGPNSGLFITPPPPPPKPVPVVEAPPKPPVKVSSAKDRRRDREAIYHMKNRERRREIDRARRERKRAAREIVAAPPEPKFVYPVVPGESMEDRAKRLKRERDTRYREAKRERKAQEAKPKPKPKVRSKSKPPTKKAKCAWHECGSDAREGSKYCSRNCSNKNARSRAKKRSR